MGIVASAGETERDATLAILTGNVALMGTPSIVALLDAVATVVPAKMPVTRPGTGRPPEAGGGSVRFSIVAVAGSPVLQVTKSVRIWVDAGSVSSVPMATNGCLVFSAMVSAVAALLLLSVTCNAVTAAIVTVTGVLLTDPAEAVTPAVVCTKPLAVTSPSPEMVTTA
jgi:hypothetical protein